jgi:hypothetical protein
MVKLAGVQSFPLTAGTQHVEDGLHADVVGLAERWGGVIRPWLSLRRTPIVKMQMPRGYRYCSHYAGIRISP